VLGGSICLTFVEARESSVAWTVALGDMHLQRKKFEVSTYTRLKHKQIKHDRNIMLRIENLLQIRLQNGKYLRTAVPLCIDLGQVPARACTYDTRIKITSALQL
jgi:hypothetical protein